MAMAKYNNISIILVFADVASSPRSREDTSEHSIPHADSPSFGKIASRKYILLCVATSSYNTNTLIFKVLQWQIVRLVC